MKYVDIVVITETKLDDTFPRFQFLVDGFSEPFRLDLISKRINQVNICKNMFSQLVLKVFLLNLISGNINGYYLVRITDRAKKINIIINNLDRAVDTYCQYDNILLSGDIISEISKVYLDSFLYQHNLKNLVKEITCF